MLELSKIAGNTREKINVFSLDDDKIDDEKEEWILPKGILCMLLGCICIYSALFSTGYFIYGFIFEASLFLFTSIVFSTLLYIYSKKLF